MQEITTIGYVSISAGWENDEAVLILYNCGRNTEVIDLLYLEPGSSSSKSWNNFELAHGEPRRVQLPEGFEKWEKFGFCITQERLLAPVSSLEEVLEKTRKQMQPATEPSIFKSERLNDLKNTIGKDLKPETIRMQEPRSTNYQQEAEATLQETWERVTELARAYKAGEAIDFVNIENPTRSQKVTLILNVIAATLRDWINELEQSSETDCNLIEILTYRAQDIKAKLKAIRGESPPVPHQLELETDINTETELNEIREECACHVAWFEGRLFGYEERCELEDLDLEEFNQFIPRFVKEQLFNGVTRFIPFDQLLERLDTFLQLVGYEVVPIEIGKTKVDARVHDIQASRQANVELGTIVEIILPGLRRKVNGEIVQKPVVIRGE